MVVGAGGLGSHTGVMMFFPLTTFAIFVRQMKAQSSPIQLTGITWEHRAVGLKTLEMVR